MACSSRGNPWLLHGIFYGIQLALIVISALIIFTDVDPRIAKYLELMDTNLYDGNPGLSFRPMAAPELGIPRSIISYKISNRNNLKPWVRSLDEFLEAYKTPGRFAARAKNIYNCNFNQPPPPGHVCDVEVKNLSPCITENLYSYHKATPCVFLKLNTPAGWKPVFYNDTSALPDTMPSALKDHIASLKITDPAQLNTIWVSCEGENPADMEFMGPIQFFPRRGFPGYYYLYNDIEGYLSPLIAVHFEKPTQGPLINIKCKAWARNIKHDDDSALGAVRFGLMLEQ